MSDHGKRRTLGRGEQRNGVRDREDVPAEQRPESEYRGGDEGRGGRNGVGQGMLGRGAPVDEASVGAAQHGQYQRRRRRSQKKTLRQSTVSDQPGRIAKRVSLVFSREKKKN